MTLDPTTTQLADDIRDMFRADPRNGMRNIERLLRERLHGHADQARREVLRALASQFPVPDEVAETSEHVDMRQVFGMILGRDVESHELLSTDFLERLAQSLNTIFDSLNQLISVINMSFHGGADKGDQTIRQFIGFHVAGGDQTRTLEAYLGQISTAFLTSHDAFKKAAHVMVERVLNSLDPGQVAKERSSRLKIGPLRKAEDYDIVSEKIERIRKWFDSGRFMEDFSREFESNCEAMNKTPR